MTVYWVIAGILAFVIAVAFKVAVLAGIAYKFFGGDEGEGEPEGTNGH